MNITQIRLLEEWSQELLIDYFRYINEPISLPISLFNLAEKYLLLKSDIVNFRGKLRGVSAISIPQKNWVLLNSNQNNNRLRFSMAHEISHWIVEGNHQVSAIPKDWNLYFLKDSKSYNREQIANFFAGSLLIPRSLLLYFKLNKVKIYKDLDKLADLFGVSRKTLSIRIDQVNNQQYGIEKLDKEFIESFDITGIHKDDNDLLLIVPPKKYFDNRFINKIQNIPDNGRAYFLVQSNELDNIQNLMKLESKVDFIITDDLKQLLNNRYIKIGKCKLLDFRASDNYYQRILIKESKLPNGNKQIVYTRDTNSLIPKKQLEIASLSKYEISKIKINNRTDARDYINECKLKNKKVVIVTGCFDLITDVHVRFLEKSKKVGDVLVVGIENDNRVRTFKGPMRPLNTETQRTEVINALRCVDYSFIIHGSPRRDVKQFYTRLHSYLRSDVLAISNEDPHMVDKEYEIKRAGGCLAIIDVYQNDGKTTTILRKVLKERLKSDFIFLPKVKIYEWEEEIQQNNVQQLKLPL